MNSNYLFLFGILICFAYGTVAREAIINGKEANTRNFRYMVSLLEIGTGYICGGAIIYPNLVLTAAHCFVQTDNKFKNKPVIAVMGTNDLMKFDEPALSIEVQKIYVPKEYNATDPNTTGDIAVLRLKRPFQLVNHKNLKALHLETTRKYNHSGKKATISGWGHNKFEIENNHVVSRRTDSILRYVYADVLSNHECQLQHHNFKIYEEYICAKVEQPESEIHGVCKGDDGGPLVHDGLVIGVLSKFQESCIEKGSPAIYTRVSHYLSFIRNCKIDDVIETTMRAHVLSL